MIEIQRKKYRLTFWQCRDRSGEAIQLEFDTRAEAERVFSEYKAAGQFKAGVLYEWNKQSQETSLLSSYPPSETT
jgi:hypothetical protein